MQTCSLVIEVVVNIIHDVKNSANLLFFFSHLACAYVHIDTVKIQGHCVIFFILAFCTELHNTCGVQRVHIGNYEGAKNSMKPLRRWLPAI